MGNNDMGALMQPQGTAAHMPWCQEHCLLSVTLGPGDVNQAAYIMHLKGYVRQGDSHPRWDTGSYHPAQTRAQFKTYKLLLEFSIG